MKKCISVLLTLVLIFTFTACSKKKTSTLPPSNIVTDTPILTAPEPEAPETPSQPLPPVVETLDNEQEAAIRGNTYTSLANNNGIIAAWGADILWSRYSISPKGVMSRYMEDDAEYLNVQDDTIYFLSHVGGEENDIWKINPDGTGKESVFKSENEIGALCLSDGWFYYSCYMMNVGSGIFRIRLDGTENTPIVEPTWGDWSAKAYYYAPCVGTNALYYVAYDRTIWKVDLDGGRPRRICEDEPYYPPVLHGEWLYYIVSKDQGPFVLFRIKTDGTEKMQVFSGKYWNYDFCDDRLYYLAPNEDSNDNWLWSVNEDGSGEPKLIFKTKKDDFLRITVFGEKIFIEGFWGNYIINKDGSGARSNSSTFGGDFTPYN